MSQPSQNTTNLHTPLDIEQLMAVLQIVEDMQPRDFLSDTDSDMTPPPNVTVPVDTIGSNFWPDWIEDAIDCLLYTSQSFLMIVSVGAMMYGFGFLIYMLCYPWS